MFSKSKYDVMESINFKSSMNLLFLGGKISSDLKSYENYKISKDEFNSRFMEAVEKGLPSIKAIANIGYENSQDILEIDNKVLLDYIKSNGLSIEEFKTNYAKMINNYVKVLLAFYIIENENIDIYKVCTPDMILSLINGDFSKIKMLIDEMGVGLSSNNKKLMDKLVNKSFDISCLDNKEKMILDSVHDKYMKDNIYKRISKEESSDEILKYAKNLGKKKSILEL